MGSIVEGYYTGEHCHAYVTKNSDDSASVRFAMYTINNSEIDSSNHVDHYKLKLKRENGNINFLHPIIDIIFYYRDNELYYKNDFGSDIRLIQQ